MTDEEPVSCSFCEKPQDQVRKIIVGTTGATICDECVDLCAEILDEEVPDWRGEVPPDHMGEIVQRDPDRLRVTAVEALLQSGYTVQRPYTGGLWAIVDPDHPSYATFKRHRDDYEERLRKMREE
jgi:hypothetical protein